MPPVKLTIANQKGGVGKSTTAVNLGSALAKTARVLVVDLDPQHNATSALGVREHGSLSVHDALLKDKALRDTVTVTSVERLELVPSTSEMASAEVELVPALGREFRLRAALSHVQDYDYVLIDCPPSLGLLTVNALVAADHVIVPVQCEYLALEGLAQLLATIEAVKTRLNPQLDILTILLTMEDRRNRLSMQVADEVTKHFPQLVARTRIPRSVRLAEAPSHGKPIDLYDPASRATAAYAEFAREVQERVKARRGMAVA